MQCAEAAVLLLVFRLFSAAIRAVVGNEPFRLASELRFGAFIFACAVVGGALYVAGRVLVARAGIDPSRSVRITLLLLIGALIGGLVSLTYWRRTPAPEEFSHMSLTVLATCAGALMALMLGGVVAWQDWLERMRRAA